MLPFDVITTECVMQVDDDLRYLPKEEIRNGFR